MPNQQTPEQSLNNIQVHECLDFVLDSIYSQLKESNKHRAKRQFREADIYDLVLPDKDTHETITVKQALIWFNEYHLFDYCESAFESLRLKEFKRNKTCCFFYRQTTENKMDQLMAKADKLYKSGSYTYLFNHQSSDDKSESNSPDAK